MSLILRLILLAAAVYCLGALLVLILRTKSFGLNSLKAKPQGSIKKGINYAMGRGMTPWEKESAKNHLYTYVVGVIYHLGIFANLLWLAIIVIPVLIPQPLLLLVRYFLIGGFISGMALLTKRIVKPVMRQISNLDDYISNLLVNGFLLLGFFTTLSRNGFAYPLVYLSIFLFFYIPLGKIKHCAFFFAVRILFGIFYGRRGVYPPTKEEG